MIHTPRPPVTDGARDGALLKFVVDFGCGGTERQFVNLGLALNSKGVDLHYGCLNRSGDFLAGIVDRGMPVREYSIRRFHSVRCLKQQWRLAQYIRRHDIQIVHAYNFHANVFALPAARLASTPVVIASIRDRGVYMTPRQITAQRYICRLADCVLVNADAIRDWLVETGHDARKIIVIRNGIDLAQFPIGAPRGDLRREYGLQPGTPLLGVVGRLSPSKGLEDLIDAMASVATTHPDVRAFIVGDAHFTRDGVFVHDHAYVGSLKERVRRLGLAERIIFTGYRPDVPAVLAQLTVSVQPSLNEGLSNVILESMASGVPVVATRVGGTPEAVVDGVTGLLVPPADPRALSAAIGRLLDTPQLAASLGSAARRRIEDHFSVARMVEATQDVYKDLLARKRRTRRPPPPPLSAGDNALSGTSSAN